MSPPPRRSFKDGHHLQGIPFGVGAEHIGSKPGGRIRDRHERPGIGWCDRVKRDGLQERRERDVFSLSAHNTAGIKSPLGLGLS